MMMVWFNLLLVVVWLSPWALHQVLLESDEVQLEEVYSLMVWDLEMSWKLSSLLLFASTVYPA